MNDKGFGINVLITVCVCFLYSVSDEVHQYFVPGRACRLTDVLIDVSGSILFCIAMLIFKKKFTKNIK